MWATVCMLQQWSQATMKVGNLLLGGRGALADDGGDDGGITGDGENFLGWRCLGGKDIMHYSLSLALQNCEMGFPIWIRNM